MSRGNLPPSRNAWYTAGWCGPRIVMIGSINFLIQKNTTITTWERGESLENFYWIQFAGYKRIGTIERETQLKEITKIPLEKARNRKKKSEIEGLNGLAKICQRFWRLLPRKKVILCRRKRASPVAIQSN